MKPKTIFVSATPSEYEIIQSNHIIVEQIIRPTGIPDPVCEVRSAINQVDDLLEESKKSIKNGHRILVTTISKKTAEHLAEYLCEANMKAMYIHSEIESLERIIILNKLRRGEYDIVVGVNLLREGIDIPECGLMAILDADKEGFLRSETALIQTIGRAARNINSKVILYANKITKAMQNALDETERRRNIQKQHNIDNNITPSEIKKPIRNSLEQFSKQFNQKNKKNNFIDIDSTTLEEMMIEAAKKTEFELSAAIRDELYKRRNFQK